MCIYSPSKKLGFRSNIPDLAVPAPLPPPRVFAPISRGKILNANLRPTTESHPTLQGSGSRLNLSNSGSAHFTKEPLAEHLFEAEKILQQCPDIILTTDHLKFPLDMLNAQIRLMLPQNVTTWAQLKGWVRQNPGIPFQKLLLLQVVVEIARPLPYPAHYQDPQLYVDRGIKLLMPSPSTSSLYSKNTSSVAQKAFGPAPLEREVTREVIDLDAEDTSTGPAPSSPDIEIIPSRPLDPSRKNEPPSYDHYVAEEGDVEFVSENPVPKAALLNCARSGQRRS
jgi:hypothetical protein